MSTSNVKCVADMYNISQKFGNSGSQLAVAAWAAVGVGAILYSIACCDHNIAKKLTPSKLSVWFLAWGGITVLVVDLAQPAAAWTFSAQMLCAASVALFPRAPLMQRTYVPCSGVGKNPGAVYIAVGVVCWMVMVGFAFAGVSQSGKDVGPHLTCERHVVRLQTYAAVCAFFAAACAATCAIGAGYSSDTKDSG